MLIDTAVYSRSVFFLKENDSADRQYFKSLTYFVEDLFQTAAHLY